VSLHELPLILGDFHFLTSWKFCNKYDINGKPAVPAGAQDFESLHFHLHQTLRA